MSKIDYQWNSSQPAKPDVYMTRRKESKYLTMRYWDGAAWFEIAHSNSRGGLPFTWPKAPRIKRPTRRGEQAPDLYVRRISTSLGSIQWGTPFKVYDQKEVLKWLVGQGILRADWPTHYQADMRKGVGKATSQTVPNSGV